MPKEQSDQDMETRLGNRVEEALAAAEQYWRELQAANQRIRVLEQELAELRSQAERGDSPSR